MTYTQKYNTYTNKNNNECDRAMQEVTYFVLVEGAEVVVSEEDTQLLLIHSAGQLTQATVRQL